MAQYLHVKNISLHHKLFLSSGSKQGKFWCDPKTITFTHFPIFLIIFSILWSYNITEL